MKILNLYAGLGGNRTLWSRIYSITAVENNDRRAEIYAKRFPNDEIIVRDVKEFLYTTDLTQFDLIWLSPPCKTHSQMNRFHKGRPKIPRLDEIFGVQIWLERLVKYPGHWVMENVYPEYGIQNLVGCFIVTLDKNVFWSSFPIDRKRFRPIKPGHGSLNNSTTMREEREKLIQNFMLTDIEDMISLEEIRNCVDPRIGKYVLEQFEARASEPKQRKLTELLSSNDA